MLKELLTQKGEFTLPKLPYAMDALEPHISANTLSFHYGKHHQTYVTNLNNLIKDNKFSSMGLEEIIKKSADDAEAVGIFNNAAQVWNHAFFWHCMKPNGGGKPSAQLAAMLARDFGSYENFCAEFKKAALAQFGSGWGWLVLEGNKLKILKTANADLPMIHGVKAILTIDVWEHSYYLDYQNRRVDYIDIFLNQLVNWDFAENNFL